MLYEKIDGLCGHGDITCTPGTKCLRSDFLSTALRQHFKGEIFKEVEKLVRLEEQRRNDVVSDEPCISIALELWNLD